MVQRDWFEWHQPYDDSASPLAGRLRVVQRHVVEFLDTAPPGEISVVSMCAGQGRDLLEVLTRHPRTPDVAARLVELDPRNAKVAMDAVAAAGLDRVEVITGDASTTTAYEAMVPCDLVLACGVFGHAADSDIENAIRHLPTLCAPGATVIWTRGRARVRHSTGDTEVVPRCRLRGDRLHLRRRWVGCRRQSDGGRAAALPGGGPPVHLRR